MEKYLLPQCNEVFSATMEKPSVFEAILPEYCPGIRKIIKADAVASVSDTAVSNGKIIIYCNADVRVLYLAENGALRSVSFPHSFESTFDISRAERFEGELNVCAKVNVLKAYAKQNGARSTEIRIDAPVYVSVYCCSDIELFTTDKSGDTETRRINEYVTERTILAGVDTELTDIVTLDENLPALSELTDRSIKFYITETTVENGILKYSGNSVFKCTYRAESNNENGESEYIYLKKDIPFSGELYSEKITEASQCMADVFPVSLDIEVSADPYGENRILNVSAHYCTGVDVFCEREVEFTCDGFCAAYECDFENTVYTYDVLSDIVRKDETFTENIPLGGVKLAEITDTDICIGNCTTELSDGMVYIAAKANAVICGSDDRGEMCCIDQKIVIRVPVGTEVANPGNRYVSHMRAIPKDAYLKDGEAVFSFDTSVEAAVLEKRTKKAISTSVINYEMPKPLCRSEYIIYYPDKNETLWDIAKKYEIPQSKIASANGIDVNDTLNKKTVLIPCIL